VRRTLRPALVGLILGPVLGMAALGALPASPILAQETDASGAAPAQGALPIPVPVPDEAPAPRPRRPRPPIPDPAAAPVQAGPASVEAATAPAGPAPPTARLPAGAPIPPAELEALIDGAVRTAMGAEHIPGVTVSVVQNGQTVLKKGYGVAAQSPARPVDPDRTLFRVGSISKLFTWIAVMKEVEHGRMRLDGPVNQYLPEALQVRDQGYSRPVQLRDLMTHSAGFEDRALGRTFERDPGRVRPLAVYLRQEKPRRVHAAGVMPEYSNYGAALAGEAVSQAAGRPYDDLVEAEILRPLGLAHTSFREPYPADPNLPGPLPETLAGDLSEGFRWTGAGYASQPFEYISQGGPAGAASSTAGDMARLMDLILAGGTLDGAAIYGPQTAQAFRTVTMRTGPGIDGWANGFMQRRLPGGFDGFGHEGQTLNFASNLVTVPALGLGVFVAGNSSGAAELARRLPGLIVGRFYAAPEPPLGGALPLIADRGTYAGRYLSERRRYEGLEQFAWLIGRPIRIDVSPDGRLLTEGPDGGAAFAPSDQPGRFREIDGGRMAGFQIADGVAQRWLPPSGVETYVRLGPLQQRRTLIALGVLAMIAAVATLAGVLTRDRRDFRETAVQSQASALQAATAVLWFIAVAGFAAWGWRAAGDAAFAYLEWPGAWVLVASSCALVAALCSLAQTLLLPAVWRGGRRVESWTAGRKFRFSLTALIFLAFSAMLMLWGALEPWSA
jgi:CubicO group peptidase (beta-lactamase class C family)